MTHVLLALHVATAMVLIGGVTVAASVFPRYATGPAATAFAEAGGHPAAHAMHRITKGYGRAAVITPVLGLILALVLGRLDELWVLLSIMLVMIGGLVLVGRIIPMQKQMLDRPPSDPRARKRAVASAGWFNMLWIAVLTLMIVKPGA